MGAIGSFVVGMIVGVVVGDITLILAMALIIGGKGGTR